VAVIAGNDHGIPLRSISQVISKLSAGGGLTIIQMKELEPLDPILNFDDADTVRSGTPSTASCPCFIRHA
jgi:hypothetical protein